MTFTRLVDVIGSINQEQLARAEQSRQEHGESWCSERYEFLAAAMDGLRGYGAATGEDFFFTQKFLDKLTAYFESRNPQQLIELRTYLDIYFGREFNAGRFQEGS